MVYIVYFVCFVNKMVTPARRVYCLRPADVPIDSAGQCILKEVRASQAHGRAVHVLVQFHPDS